MRRGFTLIELMAAVAILAVVSIMAAQVLGGAMLQRDLLIQRDNQGAELMRALTLLRRDFEAIAPLPETEEDPLLVEAGLMHMRQDELRLLRSGMISLDGPLIPQLGVVVWALRDGVLVRAEQRGAVDGWPLDFVTVLPGVNAFGVVPLLADPEMRLNPAPGYEITLQTEIWGPLRLVVAR